RKLVRQIASNPAPWQAHAQSRPAVSGRRKGCLDKLFPFQISQPASAGCVLFPGRFLFSPLLLSSGHKSGSRERSNAETGGNAGTPCRCAGGFFGRLFWGLSNLVR